VSLFGLGSVGGSAVVFPVGESASLIVIFVYCFIFPVSLCCGQRLMGESGRGGGMGLDGQLNLIMKMPIISQSSHVSKHTGPINLLTVVAEGLRNNHYLIMLMKFLGLANQDQRWTGNDKYVFTY